MLDPEQNNTFQDNYLEVPFDLSKVLFIATGNLADPIPPALRDRMEIIQLPGYTQQEKIEIGKRFLVPKQMENHGLKPKHIEITDEAMVALVQAYTKEAGVRNLEREIANVMRKVARRWPRAASARPSSIRKKLVEYLGPPRFEYGELEPEDQIGAATGLVVTEVGGDVVCGRGHPHGGQGGLHPHRPAGRRHARVGASRAVLDPRPRRAAGHPARDCSRRTRSTSTSRPAPSPRTGRRPASPWPRPWSARSPASRSARTWP